MKEFVKVQDITKDSFYWYKEVIRNNGLTKESIGEK